MRPIKIFVLTIQYSTAIAKQREQPSRARPRGLANPWHPISRLGSVKGMEGRVRLGLLAMMVQASSLLLWRWVGFGLVVVRVKAVRLYPAAYVEYNHFDQWRLVNG